MPVTYRTLHPDEEEAVLNLWTAVLDDDRTVRRKVFHDFGADPRRFERTQVAVAPDGTLLAAVAYWLREIRDAHGAPRRVGHLWGVATHPTARRQGHAARLLEQSVVAMRQEGCTWSILFAREDARSLYERAGWQSFPSSYRGGSLSGTLAAQAVPYVIRRYDPRREPNGWQRLAAVYSAYNSARPLTMVRTPPYWQGYAAWVITDWLTHHYATLLVATSPADDADVCGYVLAHFYDQVYAQQSGHPPRLYISELGARPEKAQAIPALLTAVAEEAMRQGIAQGQLSLPHCPQIDTALDALFGPTLHEQAIQGTLMARPIAPHGDEQQLMAMFSAPDAIFWELDRY